MMGNWLFAAGKILPRVEWQGREIIDEMHRNNEKVIFLVPHGWGWIFRRC